MSDINKWEKLHSNMYDLRTNSGLWITLARVNRHETWEFECRNLLNDWTDTKRISVRDAKVEVVRIISDLLEKHSRSLGEIK